MSTATRRTRSANSGFKNGPAQDRTWTRCGPPVRLWAGIGWPSPAVTTDTARQSGSAPWPEQQQCGPGPRPINELKALIVTAADELRSELRDLPRTRLVKACAGFRHSPTRSQAEDQTRMALRALARRISHLNDEIADHDQAIEDLLSVAAPQLLTEPGVGPITAAAFYIAWSHPGRCRNEAAYARLAGVAPIPAISGQTSDRFRLNRGGDRQLNRAFYLVAVTRTRYDQRTKDYIARRVERGQNPTRSHPLHQALHSPTDLATPRTPTPNTLLTDIEASLGLCRIRAGRHRRRRERYRVPTSPRGLGAHSQQSTHIAGSARVKRESAA